MLLQLWIAYPDDLQDDCAAEACAAILSHEEQAYFQRFKFERHRRESLATRALVRTALSYNCPVPPEAWRFAANLYGKPVLKTESGLRFNASNALGLVVCLVAESAEVGVDVAPFTGADVMLKMAGDVFSPAEFAQLKVLPREKQLDRVLSLWTLKEAYIKARGLGLAIPLDEFSFIFDDEKDIRLLINPVLNDRAENWHYFVLDFAGHRIGAVLDRTSTSVVRVYEARPAVARPVHLKECVIKWFPRE